MTKLITIAVVSSVITAFIIALCFEYGITQSITRNARIHAELFKSPHCTGCHL